MSEVEHEHQGDEPEPTQEPEPAEHEEEEAEPEQEPEPEPEPEPQGMGEKELGKMFERLDNEAERHWKRLQEIIGADAAMLVPCELCSKPMAGFRGLVPI